MSDTSRRNFLRGKLAAHKAQQRPPWALAEERFTQACTRCGDCARACPTRIIRQGDGGYPAVDFGIGECTFCGDCVRACPSQALQQDPQAATPPWQILAAIGDACVAKKGVECRICGEQCGSGAITFPPQRGGISTPHLAVDRCTGCGACVAPCPVSAIRVG